MNLGCFEWKTQIKVMEFTYFDLRISFFSSKGYFYVKTMILPPPSSKPIFEQKFRQNAGSFDLWTLPYIVSLTTLRVPKLSFMTSSFQIAFYKYKIECLGYLTKTIRDHISIHKMRGGEKILQRFSDLTSWKGKRLKSKLRVHHIV